LSLSLIQARLDGYQCRSTLEEQQALREIMQELVLASLSRADFFAKAAFQGGTCLRIFHGLERFSEDLDFALDHPDPEFDLTPHLSSLHEELGAYGCELEIDDRSKVGRAMQHAFLKDDSLARLLNLEYRPRTGPPRKIRVKLEVDTNPPLGAQFHAPFLEFPFPATVRNFNLPSLFAGKLHALLCRPFVKGRDWYDLIWYVSRRAAINHQLLTSSIDQQGPWAGQDLQTDDTWCREQLAAKVDELDWPQVAKDVERFVKQRELRSLRVWSRDFFRSLVAKVGSS